ncbi:MAG TPA: VWA domain-containing protein [Pyrinomonadaceae bacterium]|nr:VWA domain-containing protein [Pyrinomonadaceae bacterium]
MRFRTALITSLFLAVSVVALSQTVPKEQQPAKNDDVLKITTNLVQVDAVVTDKAGRQVTDLKAEDFVLLENGREQKITAFMYVSLTSQNTPSAGEISSDLKESLPPRTLHAERPEHVQRVLAILIDDFGLSAESIARLRGQLAKFIQEQTSPTDLLAVIRTSGGPGAMQQFTSNRAHLLTTVRRLRWATEGRAGMSGMDSLSPIDRDENGLELRGYTSTRLGNLSGKHYFPGTLASLEFVIRGLTRFPGRKSVVLISDNVPATSKEDQLGGVTGYLDKLIELANRSSIVISTMDPRGLPKAGLTADDSQYNLAANQIHPRVRARRMKFNVDQDALSYLAQQTGGVFVHGTNDLNHGLRRIVDSEQGYYLLGYRPDDSPDQTGNRSYRASVKLKRPELKLRTRTSFHRTTPLKESDTAAKGKDDFLREALASPFVREDVKLKMTALYTGGSQITVLLHVDGHELDLVKSADNTYKGSFDVVAVAFDDNGKVGAEVRKAPSLNVPASGYERFRRDGFNYSLTMPIRKAGSYQVRLALRDAGSGELGSDSQVVEVPEKTHLSVAGFIVQATGTRSSAGGVQPNQEVDGKHEAMNRGMEVRRFEAGDLLTYSYLLYGTSRRSKGPNLTATIRLFRGDKEVLTSNAQPLAVSQNVEPMLANGNVRLGPDFQPGEYFMQVVVTDRSAPPEKQVSEQWIDFEIVAPYRIH